MNEHIHCARVYIAQARATRHRGFAFTLLEWAARARRRAVQARVAQRPAQGELFA